MESETILINRVISDEYLDKVNEYSSKSGKSPLFFAVGDLSSDSSYGECLTAVYEDCILGLTDDGNVVSIAISDIEDAYVKRMYGNAAFYVKKKDGSKILFMRFSLSVAECFDTVASFITKRNSGVELKDCMDYVEHVYNHLESFCPKCNARLPGPGQPCPRCGKHSSVLSILAGYMKPYIPVLVVSLLISVITTFASLLPPYITSQLVDNIIPNKDTKMLLAVVLVLVGVYLVQTGAGAVRNYLLRIAGTGIMGNLKKDIYEKAQYLPMKFYDKTTTGGVINRVNSDTTVLKSFMMTLSQDAVIQFCTMIGIVIVMFVMNWKLTLLSLITVPFVAILSRMLGKKIAPKYISLWKVNYRISSILSDTIPAIRVVKAFTGEKKSEEKFNKNVDAYYEEDKSIGKIAVTFPAFITFLIMCGSVLIWYFGGRMVIGENDGLTLGVLVSFISYTSMFYAPINFFANLSDTYRNASASAERIFDIIRAEPEHDFAKGKEIAPFRGKIEFRDVNFSFDRTKKVLSNVSFVINPGDVVGIVGTTGSGKTTMINLIMRYYDDYEGTILVDDMDIRDIDLSRYRDQIGYVQQEPVMFNDSIFNNIAYSKPNSSIAEVMSAADVANAHDFITRMPDAYDTIVGSGGVSLSGGEKQRLSIARAILRNPAILIFDEATSAVDSETEKMIQNAIDKMTLGRTTIMIAHRLSTLKKANKIIVVDGGRIIEAGAPEDLLAMKGKYYRLVNIQSMSEEAAAAKSAERIDM